MKSISAANKHSVPEVPWKWWEAFSVGFIALIGVDVALNLLFGISAVIIATLADKTAELNALIENTPIWLNFLLFAIARFIGFWLIIRFIKRRKYSLKRFGFIKFNLSKNLLRVLLAGGALIALTSAAFYIVEQLLPNVNLDQEQDIAFTAASSSVEIVLAFIALVIIAPVVEEAIFRGLLLTSFIKRFGLALGVLLSSLLFGLVHWQPNVGIVTFIMGLILAWLYLKSRSLYPAIMFHSLKNLVAFGLIFWG